MTFRLLLTRPGNFIHGYIRGKRRANIKPFSYFLFVQTVFVIVFLLMGSRHFAYIDITIAPGGAADRTEVDVFNISWGYFLISTPSKGIPVNRSNPSTTLSVNSLEGPERL
jgi:hypothetical protein